MFESLSLPIELNEEIEKSAEILEVPSDIQLVSTGQKMNFIPFVKSGIVRVYIENNDVDKEQLLYYLGSGKTCLMSIVASYGNKRSLVSAKTEESCEILKIPNKNIRDWQKKYPKWNDFILDLFVNQYQSLLDTIDELSFKKIDERLLSYLNKNKNGKGLVDIKKSHLNIANDLATSREVITRTLKKLVAEKKINKLGISTYSII